MGVDGITLNFSPSSLMLLNVVLGIVMFGIALHLKIEDFLRLAKQPQTILVGLFSQFLFLPAITLLLVLVAEPQPSIALGLLLVASCPGGNISNFITQQANGNAALSVSLTAFSTLIAVVMTPLSLAFWGGLYPPAAQLLQATHISFLNVAFSVGVLLVLPLILGMWVNRRYPTLAGKLRAPLQKLSMVFFLAFVVLALMANWQFFLDYAGLVALLVIIHNAVGLLGGYGIAGLARLAEADRRAIAFETGIQNSGLALVLIFNHFDALGGMAVVAAFWGMWHFMGGAALAWWFKRGETVS